MAAGATLADETFGATLANETRVVGGDDPCGVLTGV